MSSEPIETEADEGDRQLDESIRTALQGLKERANVENAFGEPIESAGKTIVPVARIAYGFGGGSGSSSETDEETDEGAGAGGAVVTKPLGVLEITEHETRFVRFTDWKRVALAVGVGILVGILLGRR